MLRFPIIIFLLSIVVIPATTAYGNSDLYGSWENEVNKIASENTIHEPKALQIELIQKLSYMQLLWERSRLIDLDDIYHN